MSSVELAGIAFVLILGSTVAGTVINARLPEHHLSGDSKDIIRVATGLVATLTALVIALLFAATRSSFEQTSTSIGHLAADLAELDDLLEQYGPEAAPIRVQLRQEVGPLVAWIWRAEETRSGTPQSSMPTPLRSTNAMLRNLKPQDPGQAALHAQASQVSLDMAKVRLALNSQPTDSMSTPFMIVVVLWLMFIFATFSMLAKPNPTLTSVLYICVVSACGALYLILEMEQPFDGLMQVSQHVLRTALPPL